MLARKGYSPGLAVSVVRQVMAEQTIENEALVDYLEAEAALADESDRPD